MVALKNRKVTAVGGVLALIATGCGTSDNDGIESSDRLFIEIIGGEPDLLNPQLSTSPNVRRFAHSTFETLVGINSDAEVFPLLARDWEFSDDNLEVTFRLEEGVTWHDGEPFTSSDVQFNFEEIFPLDSLGAELVERIDSIETPDDHTVTLRLSSEYGPLLENLATQFMLPEHIYESGDPLSNSANMEPVGTGPFEFVSFSPGEEINLVRNEDWWRGEIEVDRLIYQIVGDTNARALSLTSGEVDAAVLDPTRQAEVESDPDVQQLQQGEFPAMIFAAFNTRNEPLDDPEVRRLLYSAIDRERISEVALYGLATPATSFMSPVMGWAEHPNIDFDEAFALDIDAINQGLDEAGYPRQDNGIRFTLDVRYITGLADVDPGIDVIRSTMESVGVEVNLVSGVNMVFIESVYQENDFDLAIHAARGAELSDPNLGLAQWYVCNPENLVGSNPTGFCDEDMDEAAEEALSVADPQLRADHLYDLQELAAEEMFHAPIVWSDVFLPTVNMARWSGLDDPDHAVGGVNWLALEWNE